MNKSNWSAFKIIFAMQLSNYKKDLFVVFSGWIITTITLVVWLAFKNAGTGAGNKDLVVDNFIVASAIGISVIRNCLFNLVKTIYDFKSSMFLDRLFSTKVSKTFVFSIIILFSQIVNILVAIFMFAISMLFPDQRQEIVNVNWPVLFLGFFLLAISSNLIALIIVFHAKSYEWASVIANLFYFLPMFLLGLGIPWTLLEQNKPIIIIGFFLPQRYFLNIMASGWADDIGMKTNQFGYNGNFWIPYLVSLIILILLTIWLVLLLKKTFGYKKKLLKKYPTNLKHIAIIYSIKKANSIEELNQIIEVKNLIIEAKKRENKVKGKNKNDKSKKL